MHRLCESATLFYRRDVNIHELRGAHGDSEPMSLGRWDLCSWGHGDGLVLLSPSMEHSASESHILSGTDTR